MVSDRAPRNPLAQRRAPGPPGPTCATSGANATRHAAHPGPARQPAADRRGRRRGRDRVEPGLELRDSGAPASCSASRSRRRSPSTSTCSARGIAPLERLADEMEHGRSRAAPAARRVRRSRDPRRCGASNAPSARCSTASRPSAGSAPAPRSRPRSVSGHAVARDLHDEVNQALTALRAADRGAARQGAARALRGARRDRARWPPRRWRSCSTLARGLRPTALDDLGLKAALAGLVEDVDRQTEIARRASRATSRPAASTSSPTSVQLVTYRVAQEALSNAVRHSGAKHVRVRLIVERGRPRAARLRRRRRLRPRQAPGTGSGSPACASGRCSSAARSRSSRSRASGRGSGCDLDPADEMLEGRRMVPARDIRPAADGRAADAGGGPA